MKKEYEKPIFKKTVYISIDNIATEYSILENLKEAIIMVGVADPCSCDTCYSGNMCMTECSTDC